MEITGTDIGELIGIGTLLIGGFRGWVILQKDITRLDTEMTNVQNELHSEKETNAKWFEKIEHKLDSIMQKLMK